MKNHILFSFRRCPYAIRARWAIKMCELKVELREVNLKKKPPLLIESSSTGSVPLLILNNGEIIEESLDIILWALKNSKNNCLDKYYKKSSQKEILEIIKENDQIFKYHLDRFKYHTRFNANEKEYHFFEAFKCIKKWNFLLKKYPNNKWLIGGKESIADWCLWPFVRQFKIACESQKIYDDFPEPLNLWFDYFAKHKNINEVMHKYSNWETLSEAYIFPNN